MRRVCKKWYIELKKEEFFRGLLQSRLKISLEDGVTWNYIYERWIHLWIAKTAFLRNRKILQLLDITPNEEEILPENAIDEENQILSSIQSKATELKIVWPLDMVLFYAEFGCLELRHKYGEEKMHAISLFPPHVKQLEYYHGSGKVFVRSQFADNVTPSFKGKVKIGNSNSYNIVVDMLPNEKGKKGQILIINEDQEVVQLYDNILQWIQILEGEDNKMVTSLMIDHINKQDGKREKSKEEKKTQILEYEKNEKHLDDWSM